MASAGERSAMAASRRAEVCLEIARRARNAAGAKERSETGPERKEASVGRRFRAMDVLLRCADAVEAAADAARAEKEAQLACRSFLAGRKGNMADLVAAQAAAKDAEEASTRANQAVQDGLATRAAALAATRARNSADEIVSEALRRCSAVEEVLEVAKAARPHTAEDARRLAACAHAEADASSWSSFFPPPDRATESGEEAVEQAIEKMLDTMRERNEQAAELIATFVLGALPSEEIMEQKCVETGTEETELALSRVEYVRALCEKIRDHLQIAWEERQAQQEDRNPFQWVLRAETLRHSDAVISSIVAPNSTHNARSQAAADEDGGWILEHGCGSPPPWVGLSTVMHRQPWLDAWMDAEQETAVQEMTDVMHDVDLVQQSLWEVLLRAVSRASVLQQSADRGNFVLSVIGSAMDLVRTTAKAGGDLFASKVLRSCAQVISQVEDEPFFLELEEATALSSENEGKNFGGRNQPEGSYLGGSENANKSGFLLEDIVRSAMDEADRCAEAVAGQVVRRFRREAKAYARNAGIRMSATGKSIDTPDADLLRALYLLDEDLSEISQATDQASYLHIWRVIASCVEEFFRRNVLATTKTISKEGTLAFAADIEAATAAMDNFAPKREHSGMPLSVRWRSLKEAISISTCFYDEQEEALAGPSCRNDVPGNTTTVASLRWLTVEEGKHLLSALSRGATAGVR
eukprot:scaffold431_cov334-Pavlova_lutheri.AAC.98